MSCATTILKDPENAIAEIDQVLNGMCTSGEISEIKNFSNLLNSDDVSLSTWIVSLEINSFYGLFFAHTC